MVKALTPVEMEWTTAVLMAEDQSLRNLAKQLPPFYARPDFPIAGGRGVEKSMVISPDARRPTKRSGLFSTPTPTTTPTTNRQSYINSYAYFESLAAKLGGN